MVVYRPLPFNEDWKNSDHSKLKLEEQIHRPGVYNSAGRAPSPGRDEHEPTISDIVLWIFNDASSHQMEVRMEGGQRDIVRIRSRSKRTNWRQLADVALERPHAGPRDIWTNWDKATMFRITLAFLALVSVLTTAADNKTPSQKPIENVDIILQTRLGKNAPKMGDQK